MTLLSSAPKSKDVSLCKAILYNDPEISDCAGSATCAQVKGSDWTETPAYESISRIAESEGLAYHPVLWSMGHHHHYHIIVRTDRPLEW